MLMFVLILILAAAAGVLGDLLEVAGWLLVVFIAAGAAVGFFAWRWFERLRSRL